MNAFTKAWFEAHEEEDDDDPVYQDPEVSEDEAEGIISKVKFSELIKDFPDLAQVRTDFDIGHISAKFGSQGPETAIILEIQKLQRRLDELTSHMGGNGIAVKQEE